MRRWAAAALIGALPACTGAAAQQPPSFAWPRGVPLAVSLAEGRAAGGEPGLLALVEQAALDSGGRALLSITSHGVGGDHRAVSREAHERLLRHLAAHPERYRRGTFVNIMRHVRASSAPSR
jgi:hypothetical protein